MRAALFAISGPFAALRAGSPDRRIPPYLRLIHYMCPIIDTVPNQQREILAGEGVVAVVGFLIPDIIAEMPIFE